MEEKNAQGSGHGHPRVHDYTPQGEERRGVGNGESRVRISDEPLRQQGDGGAAEMSRQRLTEPATAAWSFASEYATSSYSAFETVACMMLSWQREVAGFCAMRIGKDLEYGRRLSGTWRVSDLLRLNSDYTREMLSDYASSIRRITEQAVDEAEHRGAHSARRVQETAEHLRASAERATER